MTEEESIALACQKVDCATGARFIRSFAESYAASRVAEAIERCVKAAARGFWDVQTIIVESSAGNDLAAIGRAEIRKQQCLAEIRALLRGPADGGRGEGP